MTHSAATSCSACSENDNEVHFLMKLYEFVQNSLNKCCVLDSGFISKQTKTRWRCSVRLSQIWCHKWFEFSKKVDSMFSKRFHTKPEVPDERSVWIQPPVSERLGAPFRGVEAGRWTQKVKVFPLNASRKLLWLPGSSLKRSQKAWLWIFSLLFVWSRAAFVGFSATRLGFYRTCPRWLHCGVLKSEENVFKSWFRSKVQPAVWRKLPALLQHLFHIILQW